MGISTDIQQKNKYYKLRHIFVPLNIPLLHIYFTASSMIKTKQNNSSTSSTISDGLTKIGNALNPLNVIDNIGDGIKKLLPNNDNHNNANSIFVSPSII